MEGGAPISVRCRCALVREIWKARPMNMALDKLVMKNRRIRSDEVRTEGKLLASLLRGWAMIASVDALNQQRGVG